MSRLYVGEQIHSLMEKLEKHDSLEDYMSMVHEGLLNAGDRIILLTVSGSQEGVQRCRREDYMVVDETCVKRIPCESHLDTGHAAQLLHDSPWYTLIQKA
ncbi:hypothetical protein GF351_01645 [Candidatus Woesearchaeota archaeon]|nr:hypothetical protein [Candidatus Woesearchaeota archaeon]